MADGALFLGRMLMPVGTPANILGARPVVMKGLHHEERHEYQEQHPLLSILIMSMGPMLKLLHIRSSFITMVMSYIRNLRNQTVWQSVL